MHVKKGKLKINMVIMAKLKSFFYLFIAFLKPQRFSLVRQMFCIDTGGCIFSFYFHTNPYAVYGQKCVIDASWRL